MNNHFKFVMWIIILVSSVSFVFGRASFDRIWDVNSEAKEILIGSVLNIHLAPPSWNLTGNNYIENKYFEFGVIQVRKTGSNLTKGKIIKIPFFHSLLPMAGGKEVIVNKGDLIKIYANPSNIDDDIFELAIMGDSVIRLKNLNDTNIEEVSKDCFVYKGYLLVHFKNGTTKEQAFDIIRRQHPRTYDWDINTTFYIYLLRNSSYSYVKKYIDAYEKEEAIECVEFYNHNESCYSDYFEKTQKGPCYKNDLKEIPNKEVKEEILEEDAKIPEKTAEEPHLNIFQKIRRWALSLFLKS